MRGGWSSIWESYLRTIWQNLVGKRADRGRCVSLRLEIDVPAKPFFPLWIRWLTNFVGTVKQLLNSCRSVDLNEAEVLNRLSPCESLLRGA